MNDFFTPEHGEEDEAELERIRAEIQAEVFEGKTPVQDSVEPSTETPETSVEDGPIKKEGSEEPKETPAEKLDDPDAKFSAELNKISQALNMLTANFEGINRRVKQTEHRIGGINNHLKDIVPKKEVAVEDRPSQAQLDEAAKSDEGWEDLQKNFPEWAKAFQSKIQESTKNFVSKEELASLRQDLSDRAKTPEDPMAFEKRLIGIAHPDWKQIIATQEYADWVKTQPAEIITKAFHGTTAEEAIDVLSKFKSSTVKTSTKSEEPVDDGGKSRLEESVIVNKKTNTPKIKSEADMSEDEYRAKIAAEIFK